MWNKEIEYCKQCKEKIDEVYIMAILSGLCESCFKFNRKYRKKSGSRTRNKTKRS